VVPDVRLDAALAMWTSFAVDATPRPLVLTGPDIIGPEYGFRDDVLKSAFCDGNFAPPLGFPAAPTTADGYPVMSAQDAFDALRAAGDGQGSETTLAVAAMNLGSAAFELDRGRGVLPAWQVSLQEVTNPVAVLAAGIDARFRLPSIRRDNSLASACIEPDDYTLTVGFVGGPPLTFDYAAHTAESRTAVAVVIETTRKPPAGVRYHPIGYHRELPVALHAPLGARVLIRGTDGSPMTVTS
jgi:hypothetical protein